MCRGKNETGGNAQNNQRQACPEAENKRKKFWQCIYAAVSLICVGVFIAILLFLFFIFHDVDNKPWTSIFSKLFYEKIDDDMKNMTKS